MREIQILCGCSFGLLQSQTFLTVILCGYNIETAIGANIDPISDKLLINLFRNTADQQSAFTNMDRLCDSIGEMAISALRLFAKEYDFTIAVMPDGQGKNLISRISHLYFY